MECQAGRPSRDVPVGRGEGLGEIGLCLALAPGGPEYLRAAQERVGLDRSPGDLLTRQGHGRGPVPRRDLDIDKSAAQRRRAGQTRQPVAQSARGVLESAQREELRVPLQVEVRVGAQGDRGVQVFERLDVSSASRAQAGPSRIGRGRSPSEGEEPGQLFFGFVVEAEIAKREAALRRDARIGGVEGRGPTQIVERGARPPVEPQAVRPLEVEPDVRWVRRELLAEILDVVVEPGMGEGRGHRQHREDDSGQRTHSSGIYARGRRCGDPFR